MLQYSYCKQKIKEPARDQTFNEDISNFVVLVTNVSFESSIGVEVVVIIDSGNNEFTDCRSIRNQCTFISLVNINFTVEW